MSRAVNASLVRTLRDLARKGVGTGCANPSVASLFMEIRNSIGSLTFDCRDMVNSYPLI